MKRLLIFAKTAVLVSLVAGHVEGQALLNVSYDPTRELYQSFNGAFVKYWLSRTGKVIQIRQ